MRATAAAAALAAAAAAAATTTNLSLSVHFNGHFPGEPRLRHPTVILLYLPFRQFRENGV